ncbi:MAG: AAA family ATPase [Nitrospira sp.]|jgi:general secretion pathway protein A|nr:AAA family ATPase [Nitrospira sp.]
MYETFYHLNTKPFTLAPNPDFLYRGDTHRLAMATLEYGLLNEAGFVVLTGMPGMGKTTLLQQLLAEHQHRFTTGLITNTHSGMDTLLPWILLAFGLGGAQQDKLQAFHEFEQFLAKEFIARRRVLLIVDEAQNLGANLLEELRLLSNLNKDKAPILQIILSGQPDLRQLLQRKDLTQFAQRVMVDYSLEPFKEEDSLGYIAHRLRVAGREEPIFTHHATRMIHRLTGGIPRLINQLCDTALTYGFAEEAPFLSTKIVAQAAKDRSKGGILPLTDTDALTAMTSEQDAAEQAQLATFASRTASTPSLGDRSAKTVQATTAARPPSHDAGEAYERGLALKKVGLHKDALQQFSLAAQDAALTFRAMAQVGICLKSLGQSEDAATAFRKALQAQRGTSVDTIQVRYLLARTLESLGRIDDTLEHYRWIKREEPNFKDVAERIERLGGRRSPSPLNAEGTGDGSSWVAQLQRILGASK